MTSRHEIDRRSRTEKRRGYTNPICQRSMRSVRSRSWQRFQFRATNRWQQGTHSRSRSSRSTARRRSEARKGRTLYDADHPAVLVGTRPGADAVEFLLHALGGVPDRGHRQHRRRPRHHPLRGGVDGRGRHRPARGPRALRQGPQRLRGHPHELQDQGRRAGRGKIRQIIEQSRKRSAVYDVLTKGTPVSVSVTVG